MELIQNWFDRFYNATNNIYQLPNGLKVLHTIDPKTTDTTINVVTKSGAYRDIELGLKKGTTHFLEHMVFGTPNKVFKSDKASDRYTQGTQTRAIIHSNASTYRKFMSVYGWCNSFSEDRLIKYLYSQLDYPFENFSKYIEKQRKIIIAERANDRKLEDDETYNYSRFLIEPYLKGYTHNIVGEIDDLKKLSPEDLEIAFNNIFVKDNLYVTVQSNKAMSKKMIENFTKLDNLFTNTKEIKHNIENCVNQRKIGFFQDKYENGFRIELAFFSPVEKSYDYSKLAKERMLHQLLNRVSYLYIREKHGLSYSYYIDSTSSLFYNTSLNYLSFKTSNDDSKKLVHHLARMLKVEVPKYMRSKKCVEWMESVKSSEKFPQTVGFSRDYASNMSFNFLEGYEVFDKDKLMEEILKVTINDLEKLYEETIIKTQKHIWVVSDREEKEVMKNINLDLII